MWGVHMIIIALEVENVSESCFPKIRFVIYPDIILLQSKQIAQV
jgi:hypothetical protein